MQQIKVAEILGSNLAAESKDGQKLYEVVHPLLQAGEKVEVDFTGIKITLSIFFNFSIGHLVKDCPMENLTVVGLDDFQQQLVKGIIENAKSKNCRGQRADCRLTP